MRYCCWFLLSSFPIGTGPPLEKLAPSGSGRYWSPKRSSHDFDRDVPRSTPSGYHLQKGRTASALALSHWINGEDHVVMERDGERVVRERYTELSTLDCRFLTHVGHKYEFSTCRNLVPLLHFVCFARLFANVCSGGVRGGGGHHRVSTLRLLPAQHALMLVCQMSK